MPERAVDRGEAPRPLLGSIRRVALICLDYPRSRDFCHRVLGLPTVHEA